MSAIFDALFAGLEQLEGDPAIRREMRWALDALHECSHEHEDWLNRPQPIRVAALRVEKAIAQADIESPMLAVISVNGVDYGIPRPVADEIAYLRSELAHALAFSDELRDELARVRGESEPHASGDRHAVDIVKWVAFLDELHAGLDHNMYRATRSLMHAFPELTRREATVVVMCWIDEWDRKYKETQ